MLYIVSNGKMAEKVRYIDFKDKYILNMAPIAE